jgi:hypothetical protein
LGFDQREEDGNPSGGTSKSSNEDTCVVVDGHTCCGDGTFVLHGNPYVSTSTCLNDI